MNTRIVRTAGLVLLAFAGGAVWVRAGDVEPPAASEEVTPKAPSQVEPRTPITALPFTITGPGSYYLTGNLTGVSGSDGITIAASASHVTIDLCGFTLTGVRGSGSGITTAGTGPSDIAIRNGAITGWGRHAINTYDHNVTGNLVEDVRAVDNAQGGILLGFGAVVRDCITNQNGGVGIETNGGATVTHCVANGGTTTNGYGIIVGNNCTVSECSASFNAQAGFSTGFSTSLTHCVASGNTMDGIVVPGRCQVENCVCDSNGSGAAPASGIRVNGAANRIESNNTTVNGYGVNVTGAGNFVVHNSSGQNTAGNYHVSGTQTCFPIPAKSGPATTNAWANFEY